MDKIWDLLISSTPKILNRIWRDATEVVGGKHLAKDCRFTNEKCHNRGKVGHINRACRIKTGVKKGVNGTRVRKIIMDKGKI